MPEKEELNLLLFNADANSIEKTAVIVAIFLFALSLFAGAGGWAGFNLAGYLAFADHFNQFGSLAYSSGYADGFFESPVYFPGFGLLAIPFVSNLPIDSVILLKIFAALFILAFIWMITNKAIEFGMEKRLAVVAVPLLVSSFAGILIGYASDYKPDLLFYAIFILAFNFIFSKTNINLRALITFALLFVGLILKQQFVGLWFAYMAIVFFWAEKDRVKLLTSGLLALIFAVWLLFSIPNLYVLAIQSFSTQSFYGIVNFGSLVSLGLKSSWPLIVGIVIYLLVRRTKHISRKENAYLFACVAGMVLPWLSLAKVGGTEENFMSGLALWLPISIVGLSLLSDFSKISRFAIVIMLSAVLSVLSLAAIVKEGIEGINYYKLKIETINYLKSTFPNKNIVNNDAGYVITRELTAGKKSSTTVVDVYEALKKSDVGTFDDEFRQGVYPLFVTAQPGPQGAIAEDPMRNWHQADKFFTLDRFFEYRNIRFNIYVHNSYRK